MMQELEKRNQEANDHTMNVKKYLKEKGLLLKTDIPLEENEKLTKLAEINGSPGVKRHVVIGTDLIDNYNEKTLYLTGNVELPDNMKVIFGTAKIPPHYLKSTAVIDNHVISRTGILNRTKAKREKEALKKMESLTKNGNQQQLQQTENKTHRPRLLLPVSQVLTGEERDATMKTLREMNAKNNFLKNPRYRNTKLANSHLRQTLATYEQDTSVNGISGQTTLKPQPCYFQRNETGFYAKPEVVLYRDYLKGLQYQQEVFVYNGSSITKRVQILPPKTEFFTIIDIHYPRGYAGNGDIASGMSCKVIVRFMPDEARDYDDVYYLYIYIHFILLLLIGNNCNFRFKSVYHSAPSQKRSTNLNLTLQNRRRCLLNGRQNHIKTTNYQQRRRRSLLDVIRHRKLLRTKNHRRNIAFRCIHHQTNRIFNRSQ